MGLFNAPKPVRVEIKGQALHCVICRQQGFHRRDVQINQLGMLRPDWADPVAVCYECDHCGYLHWFMPK